jgi:hypothetical protein
MGENGKGDSVEEGECDNGVLLSDILFVGRRIEEEGRGIGTPWTTCEVCVADVLGDDRFDTDRRCVGCEYGSAEDKPTRLSTDRPSLKACLNTYKTDQRRPLLTRLLCSRSSSRYTSFNRDTRT